LITKTCKNKRKKKIKQQILRRKDKYIRQKMITKDDRNKFPKERITPKKENDKERKKKMRFEKNG
jgi:hypothetical protein